MAGRLTGKTALITAAGQGIGRASALRFAAEGATVWATDINQAALDSLRLEAPAIRTRVLNVRDNDAILATAGEASTLDILFNCAGYVHQGDLFACSPADWEFSFDLNVHSMYRMCRAFLPAMIAAGRGSVVNMASVASSVKGAPNRVAYGATKAAVIGFTKALAADFVAKGIRCNALCPGTIETPSLGERVEQIAQATAQGDVETVRKAFVARQAMGRLGTPEEIAAAALYLASDESAFMTGQAFVIDGGWSI